MVPPPAARVSERFGRRLWGAPGLGLPGGESCHPAPPWSSLPPPRPYPGPQARQARSTGHGLGKQARPVEGHAR